MPFMQNSIDENGRLKVDESNAAEIRQRAPDWTRQAALAAYLAHDPSRKFATILAVLSPPWVDDPEHENWGSDERALKGADQFEALDSAGRIGILNIENIHVYALDGQHRVMGIRGIQDVRDDGFIELRKKDGTATGKRITRDEFLDAFHVTISDLQNLLSERMNVEYIPAVIIGETRQEAVQRIRSVFSSINSYAKTPVAGETTLLDEANGYAIVGRMIGITHALFKDKESGDRVNWKNTSLPKRTHWYTTLIALKDMTNGYITAAEPELAEDWEPRFKGQVPVRPTEAGIDQAILAMNQIFNGMQNLPVFRGLASGDEVNHVRQFPESNEPNNKGHLLLRPIGQTVLARALGKLVAQGMEMDEIFKELNKFDTAGGFEAHRPSSLWYGVTYNPNKNAMNTSNQDLAVDLLIYAIQGANEGARRKLFERVVRLRSFEKDKWINFSGETETINLDQVDLPIAGR